MSALQTALSAEHAAVYGYGVIGAHLTGTARAAASRDWVAHQMARDDLEADAGSRGAQPVAAAAAYRLPAGCAPRMRPSPSLSARGPTVRRPISAWSRRPAVRRTLGARQVQATALRAASGAGPRWRFPDCRRACWPAPRAAEASRAREHALDERRASRSSPPRSAPPTTTRTTRSVLAAAGVDVLGQRGRGRVHHVQARNAARGVTAACSPRRPSTRQPLEPVRWLSAAAVAGR